MSHIINDICNELLEIGNMLGIEIEEILNLKAQTLKQKKLVLHEPVDSYKDRTGYYGTLSINDF